MPISRITQITGSVDENDVNGFQIIRKKEVLDGEGNVITPLSYEIHASYNFDNGGSNQETTITLELTEEQKQTLEDIFVVLAKNTIKEKLGL